MAKAKCKCKSAECEECPEWIFTFADLVMLMMGFFVILWVLKPPAGKDGEPPKAMSDDLVGQIRVNFGYKPDPNSTDPIDIAIIKRQNPSHGPTSGGKTSLEKQGKQGNEAEVEAIRRSKQVNAGAKVLFEPGEAKLSPESMHSLDQIAELIKGLRFIFMVKGHAAADDFPDNNNDALKMDLSLRRAQAAADYLVTRGVDRDTLRVQGCSIYEPVILRAYTGDARSLNRRVEIESTGTLVKELQDSPKSKAPTPASEPAAAHPDH